jgi:hypothetical protein
MATTYLTTDELASRIKYDDRTIRERLLDSVLIEGLHYIRPFGGRKILYLWERIEADMCLASMGSSFSGVSQDGIGSLTKEDTNEGFVIPMANGGACRVGKVATKAGKAKSQSRLEAHHGQH